MPVSWERRREKETDIINMYKVNLQKQLGNLEETVGINKRKGKNYIYGKAIHGSNGKKKEKKNQQTIVF